MKLTVEDFYMLNWKAICTCMGRPSVFGRSINMIAAVAAVTFLAMAAAPAHAQSGDCCLDGGNGSPGCDDAACEAQICAADPFCCNTSWDGLCAGAAQAECEVCGGPGNGGQDGCGDAGTGDCCNATGTPFCEDEACCSAVCAGDPFCCDTEWDGLCADAAAACDVCN